MESQDRSLRNVNSCQVISFVNEVDSKGFNNGRGATGGLQDTVDPRSKETILLLCKMPF